MTRSAHRLAPITILLSLCLVAGSLLAGSSGYSSLRASAEHFYARGAYSRANALYAQAVNLDLDPAEARWVTFRLADTAWRFHAATATADDTKLDKARERLEALVAQVASVEDRDRVWAEAQESLGDYWWLGPDHDWWQAWQHYALALDWWAGARDIELARTRYVGMVWKIADQARNEGYYRYDYYGTLLPLDILENVLKVATSVSDKQRAQYLIAVTLAAQGGWEDHLRVPEAFESALEAGKEADYYDAALYRYATFLARSGRAVLDADGGWHREIDYPAALDLYRRLLSEFRPGESEFVDDAKRQIDAITGKELEVSVSNVFLPGSEIAYHLTWRNIDRIDLSLHRVRLPDDVVFDNGQSGAGSWLESIHPRASDRVREWSREDLDAGDFRRHSETVRLPAPLETGAYLLEARSKRESSRALILVSDVSVVVKTSPARCVAYVCDVFRGAPVPGAEVRAWVHHKKEGRPRWSKRTGTTGEDGLVRFDLPDGSRGADMFVAVASGERQAFATANGVYGPGNETRWKLYAFTDRPAYRPGETVHWKVIARVHDGRRYATPSGQTIAYRVYDPRGSKVDEGKLLLNAFGAAWADLGLDATHPLGAYRVEFRDTGRDTTIGHATLFRLEEYKLPEFKVTVRTPEEDGRKKTFRLGDDVEVEVEAVYYFGGPVAGAPVELVIYQKPFHRTWAVPRDFPWLYRTLDADALAAYPGDVVRREVVETDAYGRARLTFETPRGSYQDLEYRIEARVTDASRREITGSGTVRVTRKRYDVNLEPAHKIYRPGERADIGVRAADANDQPVQASGTITVTRDHWYQVWIDGGGNEVTGADLEAARERYAVFPPPPESPAQRPWLLKKEGYHHEEIVTTTVETGRDGQATFGFRPPREGFYTISWRSVDPGRGTIDAQATLWCARDGSADIGYHGGLEIIADKDTFRAGQTAAVMLSSYDSGRYVLFSVESEEIHDIRLIQMDGRVKLLALPIGAEHVPNVFLNALSVHDVSLHTATVEMTVPPVEHYITVDVVANRSLLEPRDEATFTLTATGADGAPVDAQAAFALFDESVLYIQQPFAGDPRPFFFGDRRSHIVATYDTLSQRAYVKLDPVPEALPESAPTDVETFAPGLEQSREMDDNAGGMTLEAEAASGPPPRAMLMKRAPAPADKKTATQASPAQPTTAVAGQGLDEVAVEVRSDFRATAFWQPDIRIEDGKAVIRATLPDSLTTWQGVARVATRGSRFGWGKVSIRTAQPLMVRLQAPRFFVAGDRALVSAVVNNNTDRPQTARVTLEAAGVEVTGVTAGARKAKGTRATVEIPAGGEARVDWHVTADRPGEATFKVVARAAEASDAMEKRLPVVAHGIEKTVSRAGKFQAAGGTLALDLPKRRAAGTTRLSIQVTPSLAVTLLDALPYLVHYPYGCTEQTMSRFLPAVITARTLRDMGLDPSKALDRILAEPPGPQPGARAVTGKPGDGDRPPPIDRVIDAGLARLYDFQHGDGGWGWWKKGHSDPFMTAYVVWGMTLAESAGVHVRDRVLSRARTYLDTRLVEAFDQPDLLAWMLHALSTPRKPGRTSRATDFQEKALSRLWERRDRLNAYGKALLALSARAYGKRDEAMALVEALENGVKRDTAPGQSVLVPGQASAGAEAMGSAHWGEDGLFWRWSEGGVEATAFALRALLAIDPEHELVEPVANWLIENRRGARWNNTRDTAIVVLAMNDYLQATGELEALRDGVTFQVRLNGRDVAEETVSAQDLLDLASVFEVPEKLVRNGTNTIQIIRTRGAAPLYVSARATFFSLEEPITASGSHLFVHRQYFRLTGRPTLLKGYVYDRVPLGDGETIDSGDRVQVLVTLEAKNNYEYLVIEDLKPAGFEAVDVRSGTDLYAREIRRAAAYRRFGRPQPAGEVTAGGDEPAQDGFEGGDGAGVPVAAGSAAGKSDDYTGRRTWVYQELRDRKVALFLDRLPQGFWEIRYDFRAEVPGTFHALPVVGQAMYVPDIRGNGDEIRLEVKESDGGAGAG